LRASEGFHTGKQPQIASGNDVTIAERGVRLRREIEACTVALWGARRPDQLQAATEVAGWSLGTFALATIDRILAESITDPVGPEFMAPPSRS
jgi:aryl-alcohol dehydrogenase-like predicted oxidoreductase